MVAIVVTALLFDPVRKWIQEKLDLFFYRTRYDYRRTLIEFGRELSSETDLDKMLSSLVDRLARTLLVDRLAIFLGNSDSSRFELSKSFGLGRDRRGGSGFPGEAADRRCSRAHLLRKYAPVAARDAGRRRKPSPASI